MFLGTSEGRPDILIEDVLALELKVGLGKSERDRLIKFREMLRQRVALNDSALPPSLYLNILLHIRSPRAIEIRFTFTIRSNAWQFIRSMRSE